MQLYHLSGSEKGLPATSSSCKPNIRPPRLTIIRFCSQVTRCTLWTVPTPCFQIILGICEGKKWVLCCYLARVTAIWVTTGSCSSSSAPHRCPATAFSQLLSVATYWGEAWSSWHSYLLLPALLSTACCRTQELAEAPPRAVISASPLFVV